jgi:hypothetical protein
MSFIKRAIISLYLIILAPNYAFSGEKTTLNDFINASEKQGYFMVSLNASGETLGWVNIIQERKGDKPFFCPPGTLALNVDNYRSILKEEIKKHPSYSNLDFRIYPRILLDGLMSTFPCGE